MRKLALVFAVALTLPACAASNPSGSSSSFNSNRISREEIVESGPGNAYDLIQKLRPTWLRWRGSTSFTQNTDVQIYLDGTGMGGRDSLRNVDVSNVDHIEYLDARRATNRWGAGHVNGAIMIVTLG
jgi:hypothetical protein